MSQYCWRKIKKFVKSAYFTVPLVQNTKQESLFTLLTNAFNYLINHLNIGNGIFFYMLSLMDICLVMLCMFSL